MIRPLSYCLLSSDGMSMTQKYFNSARTVLFSVPCATTNHGPVNFKDVLSKSDWESIAGSQCKLIPVFESPAGITTNHGAVEFKDVSSKYDWESIAGSQYQVAPSLEATASTHSHAGPFLNSNRRWRSVYSQVGAVLGTLGSTLAMDAGAAESEGLKFDVFQGSDEGFNADLFREQTEEMRQEILSGDFEVKPTPYTPAQGSEAVQFYVICAMLCVAFWVGNYLAPDFIFKDSVFRNGNGEGDDDKKDDFAGDNQQVVDSQQQQRPHGGPVQSIDSRTGSINTPDDQTEKLIVGFGKSSERTRKKPRRSS